MKPPRIALFFFCAFGCLGAYGQGIQSQVCRWIVADGRAFPLDSQIVVSSTLRAERLDGAAIEVEYDLESGLARFKGAGVGDSVFVCYRRLPVDPRRPSYHRDITVYDTAAIYRDPRYPVFGPGDGREEIFSTPGLSKNGSISRGISFGNNQDVFVNSALNLQMEGQLTEDIQLTAVISDQSIPVQPEGNTQQIQEFDRVYLELRGGRSTLTAGDYLLEDQGDYFLRFKRNVQGGQFETAFGQDSTRLGESQVGVGFSKGKFAFQVIEPLEGVQGPYRLRGPNGERFIIVLAGSERVFLDGKLLQRGFNYDYVIDYNTAEITFTPNIIITQFSRIRVQFEYSDNNYARTNLAASHHQQFDNVSFFVNYYSEKDNPNRPLNLKLSAADQQALALVGDNLDNAVIDGFREADFSENQVLYESDTIGGIQRFVFSQNPDSVLFQVTFTDFGPNGGDYVRLQTTANGVIYEYVEPIGGIPQGSYRPVRIVPTPKRKQMINAGLAVKTRENEEFWVEWAVSQEDLNLYSQLDDGNNQGQAIKVGYRSLGRNFTPLAGYQWKAAVDFEYNESNFRPIDYFRYVEFDRDWGADQNLFAADRIANLSFGLEKDQQHSFGYRGSLRNKAGDVDGWQQEAHLTQLVGKHLLVRGEGFLLRNEQDTILNTWQRALGDVSWQNRFVIPGFRYSVDQNEVRQGGEALRTAMNFVEYRPYLKTNDTARVKLYADHVYREDKDTLGGDFLRRYITRMSNGIVQMPIGKDVTTRLQGTYRTLRSINTGQGDVPTEETVQGRFDLNAQVLKGHVRSELVLTAATGRELRREFIFLEVPLGEGTHIYLGDQNNNGIQDLDEFVLKPEVATGQREYIKAFVPTDDFIKAFSNTFNYRVDLQAPRSWARRGPVLRVFSRFSNLTSWNVSKRLTSSELAQRFNPFDNTIATEDLLSIQEQIRSTFFYNRSNPRYGLDLTYRGQRNKQLLTDGFDSTGTVEWEQNSRITIQRRFTVQLQLKHRTRQTSSDVLTANNYSVVEQRFTPEFSFQPTNKLRLTGTFSRAFKVNQQGPERADFTEFGIQARANQASKRTLTGRIRLIRIDQNQDALFETTALGFEMLEGLRRGSNFNWNFQMQQRLASGLQISLNYEGRKSEGASVIHVGRMQVTALF